MRKYLLPKEGNFYKANLHTHSTESDGQLSPEELKAVYKAKGYSVLAYTDHDILIPHPELADEEFLPLNGYEMELIEPGEGDLCHRKTCHMCFIGLEPDNVKQVCWHRTKYLWGNAALRKDKIQFYEEEPDYVREYTPECISDMMKRGREHGFFVTYNHPTWSGENYEQYMKYENMHAMEICNYECVMAGFHEYNPRVYEDMLRGGKQIYCIGADDCHSLRTVGGAWVMIKAEKLAYRTITKALEDGHFYASTGPEIRELWVEDGVLHVETSDAACIRFAFGDRRASYVRAEEGKSVNRASVELYPLAGYVRVIVEDRQGGIANSNAYFLENIL